jgi:hypothetical protein
MIVQVMIPMNAGRTLPNRLTAANKGPYQAPVVAALAGLSRPNPTGWDLINS